MPHKDKEINRKYHREYDREYYKNPINLEKKRARQRTPQYHEWLKNYSKTPQYIAYRNSSNYKNKKAAHRREPEVRKRLYEFTKQLLRRRKLEAISKLGGKCICCSENDIRFLTISHLDDKGKEHRLELNPKGDGRNGSQYLLYNQIINGTVNKKYKLGIECANCNMGKAWNRGICPHNSPKINLKDIHFKPREFKTYIPLWKRTSSEYIKN